MTSWGVMASQIITLKSPTTGLFCFQKFFRDNPPKFRHNGLLRGESFSRRWFPSTRARYMWNNIHLIRQIVCMRIPDNAIFWVVGLDQHGIYGLWWSLAWISSLPMGLSPSYLFWWQLMWWVTTDVAVSVCGRSGLWPFRFVAVSVCGRFGLWPFRFVAVSVCGRYGLWPFRFVAVSVVAVSVCGRYDLLPLGHTGRIQATKINDRRPPILSLITNIWGNSFTMKTKSSIRIKFNTQKDIIKCIWWPISYI